MKFRALVKPLRFPPCDARGRKRPGVGGVVQLAKNAQKIGVRRGVQDDAGLRISSSPCFESALRAELKPMKFTRLVPFVSAALLLPSLAQAQTFEIAPELLAHFKATSSGPSSSRIIGGKATESCQHPSAVLLPIGEGNKVTSICTGSLVHPEIVITAGHCNEGILAAAFTEDIKELGKAAPKKLVGVEYCKSHPDWNGEKPELSKHIDFSFCKLKSPVLDVPPTPILMGCEIEALEEGTEVTVVGFGKAVADDDKSAGVKFEANVPFNGYSESGEAKLGETGKGLCNGDSGGPAYVKLPESKYNKDAGWRVFGVTSYGSVNSETKECVGPGAVGMMHTFVEFVEKESGIDITPCFDEKGKWDPSRRCTKAPLDPFKASGSWPDSCKHAPMGGRISSCGDAFTSDDDEKPKVKISSPGKGDSFKVGKKVKVEVEASDNEKVDEVVLLVDGKPKGIDGEAPYEWNLDGLKEGEHELKAKAVDEAGNEGSSKTVKISVVSEESGDDEDVKKKKKKGEDGKSKKKKKGEEDVKKKKKKKKGDEDEDGKGKKKKKKKKSKKKKSSEEKGEEDEKQPIKKRSGCAVDQGSSGVMGFLSLLGLLGLRRRRFSAKR